MDLVSWARAVPVEAPFCLAFDGDSGRGAGWRRLEKEGGYGLQVSPFEAMRACGVDHDDSVAAIRGSPSSAGPLGPGWLETQKRPF